MTLVVRLTNEMKTNGAAVAEFSQFCERHHPKLVGLLGLFCGSRELGEELAQEALMRAYRDWPKVRKMESPAAWLYRVGTNLARSQFRRRRAEAKARGRLETESLVSKPEPTAILEMRESIVALPARMRAVVVLRYYGDLRIAEIAESMIARNQP